MKNILVVHKIDYLESESCYNTGKKQKLHNTKMEPYIYIYTYIFVFFFPKAESELHHNFFEQPPNSIQNLLSVRYLILISQSGNLKFHQMESGNKDVKTKIVRQFYP